MKIGNAPLFFTLSNLVVEEWWYDHFCHYQAASQADRMAANSHFLSATGFVVVVVVFPPNIQMKCSKLDWIVTSSCRETEACRVKV